MDVESDIVASWCGASFVPIAARPVSKHSILLFIGESGTPRPCHPERTRDLVVGNHVAR